jgi:hypothetical protein
LRGRSAEADDDARTHETDLGVQPVDACRNLPQRGLLVDAALAARLPREVLHGVGHEHAAAIDPGFRQRAVEQLACGADERMSRDVLLVAGLLADEKDARALVAFPGHGLRRVLPQVAGAAFLHAVAQSVERSMEIRGGGRVSGFPRRRHGTILALNR